MNELEKRSKYHKRRQKGLSPFCGLGEGITETSLNENSSELVVDFNFTKKLMYEVEEYLYKNPSTRRLSGELDILDNHTFGILIENGDWKHEHICLDNIVSEYLSAKGLDFEYFTKQVGTSDSDCYSAWHYYDIKGSEDPMLYDVEGDDTAAAAEAQKVANTLFTPVKCRGIVYYPELTLLESTRKKKPYDSLIKDAGNVEHNIAMFNKMNSLVDAPSTNPVSGPFGESLINENTTSYNIQFYRIYKNPESPTENGKMVAQAGSEEEAHAKGKKLCGAGNYLIKAVCDDGKVRYLESLCESSHKEPTIELYYPKLQFDINGHYDYYGNYRCENVTTDWTYEVSEHDLYVFIFESCISEEDFPEAFEDDFDPNNKADWSKFTSWLDANFDKIFNQYENVILKNWEDEALEEAQTEYDPDDYDDYVDWDSMPGGHDYM